METLSPHIPQSLMLRMRFQGIPPAASTGVVVHPALPGDGGAPQADAGANLIAPRRQHMPAIDGSHARIRFVGVDGERNDGASGMALARHACTLQGLLAANKPARPFFGPARSGMHRSTDWLRQKAAQG